MAGALVAGSVVGKAGMTAVDCGREGRGTRVVVSGVGFGPNSSKHDAPDAWAVWTAVGTAAKSADGSVDESVVAWATAMVDCLASMSAY